jgi:PBSX family phage portal protein
MLQDSKARPRAFSFGEFEVVDHRNQLFDWNETTWNGRWWEPRFNHHTLADLLHKTPYHESAMDAKTNILLTTVVLPKKGRKVAPMTLWKLAKDYLTYGHCYPLFRRDRWGRLLQLEHLPAIAMRRGKKETDFVFLNQELAVFDVDSADIVEYRENVLHLKRYDLKQEIYGAPGYLGALDAAWLNREATLLRRRYNNNGAHMGGMFVLTAANIEDADVDAFEQQILAAKGVGNFKNLFLHLPGEDKDSVRFIPVGEIANKDDFWNVKISSRNDVLAQHRVPLVLMSIMPESTGGLGKPQDAAVVFARNEIEPFQLVMDEINVAAGETVFDFSDYVLPITSTSDSLPKAA